MSCSAATTATGGCARRACGATSATTSSAACVPPSRGRATPAIPLPSTMRKAAALRCCGAARARRARAGAYRSLAATPTPTPRRRGARRGARRALALPRVLRGGGAPPGTFSNVTPPSRDVRSDTNVLELWAPRASKGRDRPAEDAVAVAASLAAPLKEHQRDAVRFMWVACLGARRQDWERRRAHGCVLAHSMGLGKTLSLIAFAHTALRATDDKGQLYLHRRAADAAGARRRGGGGRRRSWWCPSRSASIGRKNSSSGRSSYRTRNECRTGRSTHRKLLCSRSVRGPRAAAHWSSPTTSSGSSSAN